MSAFDIPLESRIRYLQRRQDELLQLAGMTQDDLFLMGEKMGHQIRGNAISFGFPELTKFAEMLESASKKKAEDQVRKISSDLSLCVNNFLEQLR